MEPPDLFLNVLFLILPPFCATTAGGELAPEVAPVAPVAPVASTSGSGGAGGAEGAEGTGSADAEVSDVEVSDVASFLFNCCCIGLSSPVSA